MFIFKRKPLLTEYYLEELKEQVGRTVEVMLVDKEETILFMKNFDLILIFSWEQEYINGSLYRHTTFNVCDSGYSNIRNIPLYEVKRFFKRSNDSIVYIDDDSIKGLSKRNQLVFYTLCELINIFDVDVYSPHTYKCTWA